MERVASSKTRKAGGPRRTLGAGEREERRWRDGADELGGRHQIPSLPHGAMKPHFSPGEAAGAITWTVITVTGEHCWPVAVAFLHHGLVAPSRLLNWVSGDEQAHPRPNPASIELNASKTSECNNKRQVRAEGAGAGQAQLQVQVRCGGAVQLPRCFGTRVQHHSGRHEYTAQARPMDRNLIHSC